MKWLLILTLGLVACEPAPTTFEACQDMCLYMSRCGFMPLSECDSTFCYEGFGECQDDMRDYFVCVSELNCGAPTVQCRAHVHEACGGWL